MGHRANYIWIKNNTPHFATSRFGALTIPNDFFWGPEQSLAWLETLELIESEEGLYGYPWVEGGVLINFDSKHCYYYGDQWYTSNHAHIDTDEQSWLSINSVYLLKMFKVAWQDWFITRASSYIYFSPWVDGAMSDVRNPLNYAREDDPKIPDHAFARLPDASLEDHTERFSQVAQLLTGYRTDLLGEHIKHLESQGHEIVFTANDDIKNDSIHNKSAFLNKVLAIVISNLESEQR